MPPTTYIAAVQDYSCDAYGAANYSECATSGTSSATDTPNSQSMMGRDSAVPADATQAEGSSVAPTPDAAQSGAASSRTDPLTAMSSVNWVFVLLLALLISILGAWIILLLKRHKRGKGQSQFRPPTPPDMPGGPSNPF